MASEFNEKDIDQYLQDLKTPKSEEVRDAGGFKESDIDQYLQDLGQQAGKTFVKGPPPEQKEALLHGIGQGVLLGSSDEMQAAIGTLGALSGQPQTKPEESIKRLIERYPSQAEEIKRTAQVQPEDKNIQSLQDLMEKYRSIRGDVREREEDIRKAYPKTYIGGEVAGGLASPVNLAVGGLLPIKGVAEGANLAQRLATYGTNIGKAGTTAGIIGGVAGGGASEADLTKGEIGQLSADVGKGALISSLGGGLIQGGISTVQEASTLAKQLPIIQNMIKGYQYGEKRIPLISPEIQSQATTEVVDAAKNTADHLAEVQQNIGTNMNKVLGEAPNLDISNELGQLDSQLNSLKAIGKAKTDIQSVKSIINDTLNEYGATNLDNIPAKDTQIIRQKLSDLRNSPSIEDSQVKKVLSDSIVNFGKRLEQVPEMADLNRKWSSMERMKEIAKINDFNDPQNVMEKLVPIMTKSQEEGIPAKMAQSTFDDMFHAFEGVSPNKARQLKNELETTSRFAKLAEKARTEGKGGFGTTSIASGIGYTKTSVADAGKLMLKQTPESLQKIADYAAQYLGKPGLKLSQVLGQALLKDQNGRNALIFTLMQQPEMRKLFTSQALKSPGNIENVSTGLNPIIGEGTTNLETEKEEQ